MAAEDISHDAHVVLNIVHSESVHAEELGQKGLAISLHNVRVILEGRSKIDFNASILRQFKLIG